MAWMGVVEATIVVVLVSFVMDGCVDCFCMCGRVSSMVEWQ